MKGKKDKEGCAPVTGVASMALVDVIEEPGQSPGQHLMVVVVRDEAVPGATNTFAAEQEAGGRWQRISTTTSSVRLASAFLLLGASSILSVCMQ